MIATSATSALHIKGKRKGRSPIAEYEVIRSMRIQHLNNGFKNKTCKDRNCMACHAGPLAFPNKLVKNLSISYCKVDPKDTTKYILKKEFKEGNSK